VSQEKKPKSPINNSYLKYSGMAIQMAAIITLGVFGGKKLDQFFNLKQPVFTLVLSLFAVFAAIYVSIKDFLKNKK
jgi:membrane protein DedA with SNARE-associated domain